MTLIGQLAFALIVITCLFSALALALVGVMRGARPHQRHRVLACACVAMLITIFMIPFRTGSVTVPMPRFAALAAYALGVPITEFVRSSSHMAGGKRLEPKRLIRSARPDARVRALLGAWLFGMLLLSWRTLATYRAAARLVRSAPRAPPGIVGSLMCELSSGAATIPFELHIASSRSSAFAWGITHARIVLPTALIDRPALARLVLAHELHHVRSRDFTIQVCTDILICVAWWNPLVWLVRGSIRREREFAADAAVLDAGAGAREYGEALLSAVSSSATAAPAAAYRSALAGRIRKISEWRPVAAESALVTPATWLGFGLLFAACILWTGVEGPPDTFRNEGADPEAPHAVVVPLAPRG